MRIRTLFVFALVLLTARPSYPEDYDPQHTMLALNMAVVSVHRILAAQDRITLDQEYQNIINNLSLGNIRSDPEITRLYEKLMDVTSRKKLRSDEAEYIRKNFDEQDKKSISSALSDLGKSSASLAREEGSVKAFFGSIGRLISVSAATYFKYEASGSTLRGSLSENLYRLRAEDLADFNELQKQLLSSSWNLLNRYNLPDEYRLVQRAIDDFCRAIEETNTPSQKVRMLQALEDEFRVYPPYWYYRAKSAQDNGDPVEAEICYNKFAEVWRPVLRRDPYMLEAVKYRILQLVGGKGESLPTDDDTRRKLLTLCESMRDNTMRDDWVNNLFAGAVYYALGERDEGVRCVEINTDFGYELEVSSAVLAHMREGVPAGFLLRETFRTLRLNEITAGLASADKRRVLTFADFLDGREGAIQALSEDRANPSAVHALRVAAFRRGDSSGFGEMIALAEAQPVSGDGYGVILPLLRSYAEDENSTAQIFLGDMYHYGFGVGKNRTLAMSYYRKAGDNGELYPQFMYIHLLLSKPESADKPKPQSPDVKPKPKKKPLIRFWPFK